MKAKKKTLNIHEVVLIKELLTEGHLKQIEIANRFGVGKHVISSIKSGKTWAEVNVAEYKQLQSEMEQDDKFQSILSKSRSRGNKSLSTTSVAEVKYILMKGYLLSDTEIAEIFLVSRKTINNIRNGVQYADIEIEEHGDFIDIKEQEHKKRLIEIAEVEDIVSEPVKKKEELSDEDIEILRIKNEFSNSLWEMKPVVLQSGKSRIRQGRMECTDEWFRKYLDKQRVNKFFRLSRDEFYAQAALLMHQAILKFSPEGEFDWNGLLRGDESCLNQVFAYIQPVLNSGMINHHNWLSNNDRIDRRRVIDGKPVNYSEYVKFNISSINATVNNNDGEPTEIGLLAGEDSNYFKGWQDYNEGSFLAWFKKNKDDLLTNRQIETLAILEAREADKLRGVSPRPYELFGVVGNNIRTTKFKLKDKVEKSWESEKRYNRIEMENNTRKATVEGFLSIVNDDDIELALMNRLLSEYILRKLDVRFVHDLIHDNLSGFDIFNINDGLKTGKIESKTLYKLVSILEGELEKLKRFNTTVRTFYKKKDEYKQSGQVIDLKLYRDIKQTEEAVNDKKYEVSYMNTYGAKIKRGD